MLVPTTEDADGVEVSHARPRCGASWQVRLASPFMAIGIQDPVLGEQVEPDAQVHQGCPETDASEAGHFVQEHGEPIARAALQSSGLVAQARNIVSTPGPGATAGCRRGGVSSVSPVKTTDVTSIRNRPGSPPQRRRRTGLLPSQSSPSGPTSGCGSPPADRAAGRGLCGHRRGADEDLAVGELHLGATDAGCAVGPQGRHRAVLVAGEGRFDIGLRATGRRFRVH